MRVSWPGMRGEGPLPSDHPAAGGVRFTATAADLAAAYRCQYMARLLSWASLVSMVVSLSLLAGFLFLVATDVPLAWKLGILACAAAGGVVFPLAMIRWRVSALARRIHGQQRALHGEVALEWDQDELRATTGDGGSRTRWTDYHRWRESPAVILFYQSDALFQFLPKRVLTPAQADALRALAAAAGLRGADQPR